MKEVLSANQERLALCLVLAVGALGVAGCSAESKPSQENTKQDEEDIAVSPPLKQNSSALMDIRYYPDGTRTFVVSSFGRDPNTDIINFKEFCTESDGDKVTMSFSSYDGKYNANISEGHIACEDGRLTESDFKGN